MSIDQKKENQKKRLAKQLRSNLVRRKAQAKQRVLDCADDKAIADNIQEDITAHDMER